MKLKHKDISHTPGAMSLRKSATIAAPIDKNLYQERPLKHDSQNLSFKGLSSNIATAHTIKISDAITKYGEHFGETAEKHFKDIIDKVALAKNSSVKKSECGEYLVFSEKPKTQVIKDIILSPFRLKIFKSVKRANELEAQAISIQNFFDLVKSGDKDIFRKAHARLNPKIANYDSTSERTWTRAVTGAIPAFFLANDAYNLSIYMNNNKELAKKEKKRRFNQEIARIAMTAGATFYVLKAFSKSSNSNPHIATLLITGVALASEFIGRKLAGNPVLPVSVKKAKEYAKKQGKLKDNDDQNTEVNFNSNNNKTKEPPKKGKLTFKNVLKVLAGLVVFGFSVDKITNISKVKSLLTGLNNKYKQIYTKDYTISKKDFETLKQKLVDNKFDETAKNYQKIVDKIVKDGNLNSKERAMYDRRVEELVDEKMKGFFSWDEHIIKKKRKEFKDDINKAQRKEILKDLNINPKNDDIIYVSSKEIKGKSIPLHYILAFPVKYLWNSLIMMPYKTVKKGFSMVQEFVYHHQKDEKLVKDPELLKNSIEFLNKLKNKSDIKADVNAKLLDSLDTVSKSNYSNAELSSAVKNSSSAITSAFLIADNYNMAMIDSQGKDKDFAEQKAKERTIQRAVRLVYGAMLIKFFNTIFAQPYHASLVGAQSVNTLYTVTTETMERTSVGLPLTESTPEKIKKKEQEHLNAEGFIGNYYRFMAKLTGKKAISEKTKTK